MTPKIGRGIDAVQYFIENSATTDKQINSEMQRDIIMPGQATGCKIDMMKMLELPNALRMHLVTGSTSRPFITRSSIVARCHSIFSIAASTNGSRHKRKDNSWG